MSRSETRKTLPPNAESDGAVQTTRNNGTDTDKALLESAYAQYCT